MSEPGPDFDVCVRWLPNRGEWVACVQPVPSPDAQGRTSLAVEYHRTDPCAAAARAISRYAMRRHAEEVK
jgi:hypothetical protein